MSEGAVTSDQLSTISSLCSGTNGNNAQTETFSFDE